VVRDDFGVEGKSRTCELRTNTYEKTFPRGLNIKFDAVSTYVKGLVSRELLEAELEVNVRQ
jgi:hypothetical protein